MNTSFRESVLPLVALIGMLVIAIGNFYVLDIATETNEPAVETEVVSLGEQIRTGAVPPPEYTSEIEEKLARYTVLNALASYTDNGFEPATLTIRQGDVVRFTNNSSNEIWIAAGDEPRYPDTSEACGSSEPDSCAPLAPQDFWEFKFVVEGELTILNNLDKSKSMVVKVE